jgi:hypothetical protein
MAVDKQEIRVTALMTAPRYESAWCRNVIEQACSTLGIQLVVSGGVYYGQCMQMMLEDAIREGAQYAVTIDGDSVFTAEQMLTLIQTTVRNGYECLASAQVRRGKPHILAYRAGERSAAWTPGTPIEVDTAHFGLTVINLEKLASVPKPWFFCQPDSDGSWRGDKIDSDIWFWKQWQKAGLVCRVDPAISIGHMEEMIVEYDDQHQVRHYYPLEWQVKHGLREANADLAKAPERQDVGVA